MRILTISSEVAWGPVGNSAAVPALQARGHEVVAIPTIVLSNHPGHGPPSGFRTTPEDLAAILDRLETLGVLEGCDAVMTGYFATPEQIEAVEANLLRMKARRPALFILVDPIIGDGDALYVPVPVAEATRDLLLPLATAVTPNRFELEWLSGRKVGDIEQAKRAMAELEVPETVATSIPVDTYHVATLVAAGTERHMHMSALRESVPHGTGDFLAGLYLSLRLAGDNPDEALRNAMVILNRAIAISAGTPVLDIAGALFGP